MAKLYCYWQVTWWWNTWAWSSAQLWNFAMPSTSSSHRSNNIPTDRPCCMKFCCTSQRHCWCCRLITGVVIVDVSDRRLKLSFVVRATFSKLHRKIIARFLFLGKDAHFWNFFGKCLWKMFLGMYSKSKRTPFSQLDAYVTCGLLGRTSLQI